MNKTNIYTLYNNGSYCDRLGTRFTGAKARVDIHGMEDSKIKSAKVYFYEF